MKTIMLPNYAVDPLIGRLAMKGWRYDEDFTAYYTGAWKLSGITIVNPAVMKELEEGIMTSVGLVTYYREKIVVTNMNLDMKTYG